MEAKGGRRRMLDLEEQFAFYCAQHRHPVNALAHALLAPPILFTALLMLHFLPLPALDAAFAVAAAYAAACLALDRRAGSLAALLSLLGWAASRALAARLGFSLAWKFVLPIQLFCWTWQFVGHGVFEKAGPSVADLPQVFLVEPFLIFLDVLQKLFGYEPYPGFRDNIRKKMEADLKEGLGIKQKKVT